MRISDWSSDVCSSDLHADVSTIFIIPSVSAGGADRTGVRTHQARNDRSCRRYSRQPRARGRSWHPLPPASVPRRRNRAAADEDPRSPRRTIRGSRAWPERKSVVEGKSVSERVDIGGRRIIKKKKSNNKKKQT